VLFEFDTFDDFVSDGVDVVENTTAYDCVDCFVLALTNSVHRTACFEYCFRLPVLDRKNDTETFQVLMVPS